MKAIFKAILPFLIICFIFLLLLFINRASNKTSDKEANINPTNFSHGIEIAQEK